MEEFRQLKAPEYRAFVARKLYRKYIAAGAPMQKPALGKVRAWRMWDLELMRSADDATVVLVPTISRARHALAKSKLVSASGRARLTITLMA